MEYMKKSEFSYINDSVAAVMDILNSAKDKIEESLGTLHAQQIKLISEEKKARAKINSIVDWDSDDYFNAEADLSRIQNELDDLDNAVDYLEELQETLSEE